MSKTLLVAQREFVENMRTKTFWIGILSFPVIIVFSIFIARMLDKQKDIRTYAVLDYSQKQWLSADIQAQVGDSELKKMFAELKDEGDEAKKLATARQFEAAFERLPEDHPLREVMAIVEKYKTQVDFEKLQANPMTAFPKEALGEVMGWFLRVSADPEQANMLKNFAADLSMSSYKRKTYKDLGDDPEKALNEKLSSGELFAYFVIGENPVATDEGSAYVSNNLTDNDLRRWYSRQATSLVRAKRIKEIGLTKLEAQQIQKSYRFGERQVSETGESEKVEVKDKAKMYAPVAFVYLLWIAVFMAAQMLLTNTVEEKSNRLIEVLLSSVSPLQLMSGKVIGIGLTGLTIIGSWIISAIVGVNFVPAGGPLSGAMLMDIIQSPLYLTSFVAYFLAGYTLYAALLVAIGSVCNSLKEAQNLMQPVFIILMIPLLSMMFVVQDPNGTIARILTYIPLFTPFLMMNRAGGPPEAWEYWLSSAVLLVSLVIAFWGAAKIFRVGILMTGKPPKLLEILRWLRAPVNAKADRD